MNNPKMADMAFGELQKELLRTLPFLKHAYGIIKVIEDVSGKKTPILASGSEYISALPDGKHAAYSFFDIKPTQTYDSWHKNTVPVVKYDFSLIVWYNLKLLAKTTEITDGEKLKAAISEAFWRNIVLQYSSYVMETITDDAKEIFSKYYTPEFDRKYLLHPYGAVRFSGILKFSEQ